MNFKEDKAAFKRLRLSKSSRREAFMQMACENVISDASDIIIAGIVPH